MHLAHYLGFAHRSETELAKAFREVADKHSEEAAVFYVGHRLARQCEEHASGLKPFAGRYGEESPEEPERLHSDLFGGTREGPLGLLRDLHDLYVMAAEVDVSWTLIAQAAQGIRDSDLLELVKGCEEETSTQMDWLRSQLKQAGPQALVVAE